MNKKKKEVFLSYGLASSIYLLFPFFGYLGERFPRHKLLLVGTILTVIGYTVIFSVIFLQDIVNEDSGIKVFVSAVTITALILGFGGYGLVYSNFLQFGTTQLQFASSSVLQAYVRWATLSSLSTGVASQLLAGGVVLSLSNLDPLLITNSAYLMIMIVVGIIVYSLRHLVIKESPPAMDPLKLIYKVMRYAKKYNYPVRPSAFTCNDDPPLRLDFAKTRYGGPFTTQQVEDVKSFWYLLTIPLCHIFNSAVFMSGPLAQLYSKCLAAGEVTSIFATIFLQYNTAVIEAVAVISIIILQLVIVPCCPKRIPNLLKRIWLGLFFVLISAIATTIFSYNVITNLENDGRTANDEALLENNSTNSCTGKVWSHYLVIIPEITSGIGLFLSITSQLEFILAQGPHSMQGVLIGITYIQYIVPFMISYIANITQAGETIIFYFLVLSLQVFSLISYSIVAYCYKYRQLNEQSDINVRKTIEEIFKRELNNQERNI